MRDIRRPDSAEPLVDRLTTTKVNETGSPVFPTIMDLLIFSAGVGLTVNRRCAVAASGKAVPYRVFENNHKEGFIYLVALAAKGESSALAPENEEEAASIFEEYAAGGLEEISNWLSENALDISGVQSLIAKIQAHIPSGISVISDPNPV